MDDSLLKVLSSIGGTIAFWLFIIAYQLNGIKNAIRESNPIHKQYKAIQDKLDSKDKKDGNPT